MMVVHEYDQLGERCERHVGDYETIKEQEVYFAIGISFAYKGANA